MNEGKSCKNCKNLTVVLNDVCRKCFNNNNYQPIEPAKELESVICKKCGGVIGKEYVNGTPISGCVCNKEPESKEGWEVKVQQEIYNILWHSYSGGYGQEVREKDTNKIMNIIRQARIEAVETYDKELFDIKNAKDYDFSGNGFNQYVQDLKKIRQQALSKVRGIK